MARGRLGMLTAPLTWGGPDLLPSAAKLGSASAFRAASPKVLARMAGKCLLCIGSWHCRPRCPGPAAVNP